VSLKKFGNLERSINTKIGVDIDPMEKVIWQARSRKSILHNELTVNEPGKRRQS
jgi:hypothetical protein